MSLLCCARRLGRRRQQPRSLPAKARTRSCSARRWVVAAQRMPFISALACSLRAVSITAVFADQREITLAGAGKAEAEADTDQCRQPGEGAGVLKLHLPCMMAYPRCIGLGR